MNQHFKHRRSLKQLLHDEHGAILIITTVYLPVIVGFFSMAVDMSYVLRARTSLQVAAESAALAATALLPDPTVACATAKTYATKNMSINATNGNVLKTCNDVILGNWPPTCVRDLKKTDGGCFVAKDCTATPTLCNAAKVTTRMTTANGNALALAFAPMIGIKTFDVTATAIAVYGSNSAPWDMSIVQDISASFTRPQYSADAKGCEKHPANCTNSGALPQAIAANQALLGCLNTSAPAGSRLGITAFTGTALDYQSPSSISANNAALKTKIAALPQCAFDSDKGTTPKCSTNTNIGGAIAATIAEYKSSPNPTTGSSKSMVIVTDGLPNSSLGCTGNNCSASGYAQDQAALAAAAGFNIFTIYYCAGTNCDSSSAKTFLAGLVKGTGTAMVSPNSTDIANKMGQVCASQPHRLVW